MKEPPTATVPIRLKSTLGTSASMEAMRKKMAKTKRMLIRTRKSMSEGPLDAFDEPGSPGLRSESGRTRYKGREGPRNRKGNDLKLVC